MDLKVVTIVKIPPSTIHNWWHHRRWKLWQEQAAPVRIVHLRKKSRPLLWLLTQSYSVVPKNLRRQAGAIFTWYPKDWGDLKTIHDENDMLTYGELVVVRGILRKSKHACLYIRNEHPLGLSYWIIHEVIIFKWAK